MSFRIKEKTVQLALYNYYLPKSSVISVIREVNTPVGNIDLVINYPTHKEMIEVKEAKSIKHAIGQLLSYQSHYPCDSLTLAYFHYNPNLQINSNVSSKYYELAAKHNISLLNCHSLFSTEHLLNLQLCTEAEKDTTPNGKETMENLTFLTFLPSQPLDCLEHLPLPEW